MKLLLGLCASVFALLMIVGGAMYLVGSSANLDTVQSGAVNGMASPKSSGTRSSFAGGTSSPAVTTASGSTATVAKAQGLSPTTMIAPVSTPVPHYIATAPEPGSRERAGIRRVCESVLSDLKRIAVHKPVRGHYSKKVMSQMRSIARGPAPPGQNGSEGAQKPPDTEIVGMHLGVEHVQVFGVYKQYTTKLLDPKQWRSVTVDLYGKVYLRAKGVTVPSAVSPNFNQLLLVLHKVGGKWMLNSVSDNYSLRTPDTGSLDPRNYHAQATPAPKPSHNPRPTSTTPEPANTPKPQTKQHVMLAFTS